MFALLFLIITTAVGAGNAHAQRITAEEYEIKVAYLYNFAKFIEWPSREARDAIATMNICVLGKDPFGPTLEAIEGKGVGVKKVRVKRQVSQQNMGTCHILFISASERDELDRILETLGNSNVLTIGDTEGFAQRGVTINFFIESKTVRFEINPKAARRAGLKISSNLLRIAKIVGEP